MKAKKPVPTLSTSIQKDADGQSNMGFADNTVTQGERAANQLVHDLELRVKKLEKQNLELVQALNIREGEQVRDKLLKSEERFIQVTECSGIWIWEIDTYGRYTYVSDKIEAILGYKPEEVVGKKYFYDFFSPVAKDGLTKTVFEAFAKKESFSDFPNPNIHKDGRLVMLETSGIPLLDGDGGLLGYRGADKDITLRIKEENALRESEFLFRNSQKAASIGSYKIDFRANTFESSEVFDQIFGITKDYKRDVNGLVEIIHPDDREMVRQHWEFEETAKLKPFNNEYRIIRPSDGEARWVHSLSEIIHDEGNNTGWLIGTIQDITDRKQAEAKLQKSNERLMTVMDNIEAFIYIADMQTHELLFVNEYGNKSWGGNIIGKQCFKTLQGLVGGPCTFCTNSKLLGPDGNPTGVYLWEFQNRVNGRWYQIQDSAIQWMDGRMVRMEVATDITGRRNAERELAQSEKKYRSLFETMAQGVVYQNADGLIVSANPSAEKILGLTLDQMMGIASTDPRWHSIKEDGSPFPGMEHPSMVALKTGKTAHAVMGVFNPLKDKYTWININAIPEFRDEEDAPYQVYTTFEDVTPLKEALEELNVANRNLEQRVEERTREILELSNLYRAILDNAGFAIITTTTEGIVHTINQAGELMLGYLADEVVGKFNPAQFHDRDELMEVFTKSTGKRTCTDAELFSFMAPLMYSKTTEWTWARKNGSKFPIKINLSSFENADGSKGGYIGLIMDVTEEKLRIDELRESEDRFYRMFHDHAAVMLLVEPATGIIIEANKAAGEFYGYDFSAKNKRSIYEINTYSREQVMLEMESAKKQQRNYFVFRHKLFSGEARFVEVHSTPIEIKGETVLFSIIHDITERKVAEEAVKNSEKTLVQITDCVPVFIALANRDLEYIFANSAYTRFFNVKKEELIGKKVKDIIGVGPYERALPNLLGALDGKTVTFENHLKNHNGEERTIQTTYTPYYQDNNIIGILNSVVDITDLKHTEEQLRKSESENRAILTAVPDLLFKLDKNGTFLATHTGNPGLFYVPPDAFLGKTVDEVLPPNVALPAAKALEQAFKSNETVTFEYELFDKGTTRYFEDRVLAISEDEALSIIRDVTQRKVAEKKLHWSESLLKKMTESSPLGFLVVDNRTDEILYFNHNFCEIWGIAHLETAMRNGELKNKDIIPCCLPVLMDIPSFAKSCEPLQFEDNQVVVEDEIPFVYGRTIRRFSAQIRDDIGQYHGRLYIFEDITSRKTTEEFIRIQRDLAIGLSACSELDDALEHSLGSVLQVRNMDVGGIYIYNHDLQVFNLKVYQGLSALLIEKFSTVCADNLMAKLVLQGKPIVGPYSKIITEHFPSLVDTGFLCVGFIPIQNEGRVIGTFCVGSRTVNDFDRGTMLSLEALAIQVGSAIVRIESEKALLSSQNNFKVLFETIDDFIFILDADGNIFKTNPVVQKRLGYSEAELQNLNILDVHPPKRRDEAAIIIGGIVSGQVSFCPVPLYTKNGEQLPVETRVIMGKWDNRDVMIGISRDIAERLKAQQELHLRESYLSAVILNHPGMFWLKDLQGRFLLANLRHEQYMKANLPLTNQNIIGKTDFDIYSEGEAGRYYAEDQKVIQTRLPIVTEEQKVCDDKLIWVETYKFPVLDKQLQVIGLSGYAVDITERKEAESALKMQGAAFESFALAIIITDINANIQWANSAFSKLTGYSLAEILEQKKPQVLKSGKQSNEFYKELWDTILSGNVWSGELINKRKDGSFYWEEMTITPVLGYNGEILNFIAIKIDISKRKQLEESLIAAIAKERELNDLKSRFVSMASHEFRTPLASILLSSETLVAYWTKMDETKIKTKLKNIQEQVLHLTDVVTDVMQVAKIQEGKMSIELKNVDFLALCNHTIQNFNNTLPDREKIRFRSDFSGLNMLIDKRLMVQVLNNLITNALKYSIGEPQVDIRLYEHNDNILFSVADHGIGISEDDQKYLFQPFFRAGNVGQIQGNGLGLNIVRESVRLHGGEITFTSTFGKGTNFVVCLPKGLIVIKKIILG